jgi:hypothetical protein
LRPHLTAELGEVFRRGVCGRNCTAGDLFWLRPSEVVYLVWSLIVSTIPRPSRMVTI